MIDPVRRVSTAVVSEPDNQILQQTLGEWELPVYIPHDGVCQLEGVGVRLLGLLIRDHHQPPVHCAQLAGLRLEVVPSSGLAEITKLLMEKIVFNLLT